MDFISFTMDEIAVTKIDINCPGFGCFFFALYNMPHLFLVRIIFWRLLHTRNTLRDTSPSCAFIQLDFSESALFFFSNHLFTPRYLHAYDHVDEEVAIFKTTG